jgi:carotenoid cleavage dioxygenase-like enzyme
MKYDLATDFPSTGAELCGSKYDAFWVLGIGANGQPGRKFFDQVVKGSWQAGDVCDKWIAPHGEYLGGEPVAVMNPKNPDEAVVICVHSIPAENRGEYLIFDGHKLSEGPIARLPLKHKIHGGFHTSFHFG